LPTRLSLGDNFVTTREKLTAKELARRALDHLPDDVTMPEIIERLGYLYHIQLGLDDLDARRTIPHEEVKRQMSKWLT
jgi:hypothetical protein